MIVKVEWVDSNDPDATVRTFRGIAERDGRRIRVRFGVDRRPAQALIEALRGDERPVLAEVEPWQVVATYECPACEGTGYLRNTVWVRNDRSGSWYLTPETCRDCGGSGRTPKAVVVGGDGYASHADCEADDAIADLSDGDVDRCWVCGEEL